MQTKDKKWLTSMRQIMAAFGVGRERVWRWIDCGAPIRVEVSPTGRQLVSTDQEQLRRWLLSAQ